MTYDTTNNSPIMADIYEPKTLTGYDTFTEAKVHSNPEHMKLQGEIHAHMPVKDAHKRLKKLSLPSNWKIEETKRGIILSSPELVNNTESWNILEAARKALYGSFLFASHPTMVITAVTSEHMSTKTTPS